MKQMLMLLFWSLLFTPTWAQTKESQEQIKSLKIAHISSALNLTNDEAEKFWPLYNAYDNKISSLRHSSTFRYIKDNEIEDLSKLSEKEASAKLQELINDEEAYFQMRKKFIYDAKKIISNRKIILLKKAEDDFNRKLLKKYKEKK